MPPTAAPTPTETEATAPYDLHEWGLLSVTRSSVELAAGPNARRMRPDPMELTVDKPVVYVHTDAPSAFALRVHLGAGYQTAERWPEHAGPLHWHVHATGAPCGADRSPYPAECTNTDGYCEALELPRYETAGASCLHVGATKAPLLFYRLRAADRTVADRLPVTQESAGFRARRATVAYRVHWRQGVGHAIRIPLGDTTTAPPDGPEGLDEVIAWLRTEMTERGLDAEERGAFERAWWGALFGADLAPSDDSAATDHPVRAADVRPADRQAADEDGDDGVVADETVLDNLTADVPRAPGAPQYDDVLLYWLEDAEIDAIARLEATPAPRTTRRAFLVRHAF